MSNLDLGELLFLALHPQGPQLIGMMAQATAQKQDRELQRQQMQAQAAQLQRANQMQDLQTRLVLGDRGALEVESGVKGDFRAALSGGQKVLETPVGRFVLPTAQKQREQAYTDYQAQEDAKVRSAARVEAARAKAKYDAEPMLPVSREMAKTFEIPLGPFGVVPRMKQSGAEQMVKDRNATKAQNEQRTVVRNNDGTLSVVRVGSEGTSVETVKGGPTRAQAGGGVQTTPAQIRSIQKDFETIKSKLKVADAFYNQLIQKKNGDEGAGKVSDVTDEAIQNAKTERDALDDQFRAAGARAKEAGVQLRDNDSAIVYGGTTGTTPGTATTRTSLEGVKARARADVKAAGETPQAIAAFEKAFKEKY